MEPLAFLTDERELLLVGDRRLRVIDGGAGLLARAAERASLTGQPWQSLADFARTLPSIEATGRCDDDMPPRGPSPPHPRLGPEWGRLMRARGLLLIPKNKRKSGAESGADQMARSGKPCLTRYIAQLFRRGPQDRAKKQGPGF
jgi:hypothetical protein